MNRRPDIGAKPEVAAAKRALVAKLLRREGIALPANPATAPARSSFGPLSFAQERFWFLAQLDPGASVYNISRALRLRGRLHHDALIKSLNAVVRRHEILRTGFRGGEDGPIQEVSAPLSLDIPLVDLSRLSHRPRDARLQESLAEAANAPFDLSMPPLLRARLVKLAAADHVLLLVLHQMVCDGWSMRVLWHELGIVYRSLVGLKASTLPALPIEYRDYARDQRERFSNGACEPQIAYWRERLRDSLPGIALPTDRPRPARQTFRGARLPLRLSAAQTRALKALGARDGATLFMVLMAAFNVWLWRYADQEDLCVGFPVADRASPKSRNLIGFCVNTLVLRTRLSGELTFRELLRRTRDDCRAALAQQDLPFDKLVEELAQERDLSRNPLFQVMFAYQGNLAAELDLPGIKTSPVEFATASAKFDLTLSLTERSGALTGFLEYSSDLFERSTVERMAGHFLTLLRAVATHADRPIAGLSLLGQAERKRLLIDWNKTARDFPRDRCLHELFEAQARKTPNATAAEFAGERWTYRELNQRADRWARYLRGLGVGRETPVGVCVDRSLKMIAGMLGILKAGGAYVPLDPKYPRERIAFMLADAQIKVLLVNDRFPTSEYRFSDRDLRVVSLDDDPRQAGAARSLPRATASDNLAYIIYTSGSTGEPKGVAIEHRNAVALLCWARRVFSRRELTGVLASTSICFDLSVFEIFAPLSWGGKVIVVADLLALRDRAPAGEITLINTVPSAMNELLAANGLPKSVRTVNLAGEPLPTELARRIYEAGVDAVYDLYGPSETTTYSTFTRRGREGRAAIGRPIANTRIYLLDAVRQPVPVGVPGELYIGGAGVARGYWRRPELTAAKFLRDPFCRDRKARMYRTGDIARYLADGNIEYLGRADHQVKVRGYRIEPGEIEAALKRHPGIRDCVVVARDESIEDTGRKQTPTIAKYLVAYLIPAGAVPPSTSELRSYLRQTLPEFMTPAQFISLEAMPLTPNGKLDRGALPAPGAERPRLAPDYVAPRTAFEELIAQQWRAVLKIDRIGVDDNFFELGGHSLLATRVVARVSASAGVEVPLRKLFEAPTVAGFAEQVEELRRHRSGITVPPIVAVPRERTLPLSFAQRRLWFLDQLEPGLTAYNMPAVYRVRGPLNVSALERAFAEMIHRHESLRTALVEIAGEPAQQILDAARLELPLIDLSDRAPDEAGAAADRLAEQDAQQPYDLGKPPLMRAKLVRLAAADHVLILNFHHAIADGSSLAVFYRELAMLYDAFAQNRKADLPALPVQYADFAVWQQAWLHSAAATPQLAYWKRQLGAGLRPLELPADFARPPVQTYRGAKRTHRLSTQLTVELKDFSRRAGATPFMTLLAALNVLFARLSGQDDIVVGSTVAGRTRSEVDGVIGFFINALALRTDLSGDPSFLELIRRVREVCLDAYTHQDVPFERVVEELNPQRDPGRNPLFQVLFNMVEIAERDLTLSGCQVTRLASAAAGAKFDLVIRAPEIDGAVDLEFIYNADLFTEARVDAMLGQFAALLSQATGDPAKPIGSYALLTQVQQRMLPDPRAKLDDSWIGAVQEIFSRRAVERPEAPAVADDKEIWTYRELDLIGNRLANRWRTDGIEAGDVVAIYAQRSAALAAAIVSVLKAGGLFVILDPAYPPARLIDYLNIARPRGWLQMAAAGELPEEIARWLESAAPLRLDLPDQREKISAALRKFSHAAPTVTIGRESPAYIAFTSGSTGQPKGVLCRHGPMTHFLPWQEEVFALNRSDRYALLSGLSYNHLQRDLFTALASGATLFVPDSQTLKDPNRLAAWLREREITVLHLTPALGRMLQTAKGKTLPAVRRIFFGGDLLSRQDVRSMRALTPNAEIVSLYGATETQRAVGYFSLTENELRDDAQAKPSLPTGQGVPDVQLLLLTASRQRAGVGEVGELYVRSPHLAAGYVGDDALTAANFLINPFTGEKGDRLYRTGDKGRYLPDGNVEWAGRIDRRASVRGFRVELAEIETALGQYPEVRRVAVVARDSAADGKETHLVAYVECAGDTAVSIDELRRFLGARLPHYMMPAYFRKMERLPLNPNGKIDYSRLSAQRAFVDEGSAAVEEPRGEIEKKLQAVFAQVLGTDRIGRRDNFFELGGHSLLAAQAAARVREALGIDLELRAFMEAPTIEALARRVETLRGSALPAGADREEIEL